jgi:hypothetical protein
LLEALVSAPAAAHPDAPASFSAGGDLDAKSVQPYELKATRRNERLVRSEERGMRKEEGQCGDAAFTVITFLFPLYSFLAPPGVA